MQYGGVLVPSIVANGRGRRNGQVHSGPEDREVCDVGHWLR